MATILHKKFGLKINKDKTREMKSSINVASSEMDIKIGLLRRKKGATGWIVQRGHQEQNNAG